MYRQIITPQKTEFTVTFPLEFVGKEVELIAFTLKESASKIENNTEARDEALEYLKNSMRIDLSNFKFDRDEANER